MSESEARSEHDDTGQHGSGDAREHHGHSAGNGKTDWRDATVSAIRFLRDFDPSGMHSLIAFDPHSGRPVDGRTFFPHTWNRMAEWLTDQLRHDLNLYFSVGEPRSDAKHGKLAKTDIARIRAVYVDCDPQGGPEELDAERARIRGMMYDLKDGPMPPSFVVDTGGGCQAFWRIEAIEANPANQQLAEVIGKHLSKLLDGDAVQNVDRIMRLPGTDNIPTALKLRKGRIRRRAEILFNVPTAYTIQMLAEQFEPPPGAEKTAKEGAGDWEKYRDQIDMDAVRACEDITDVPGDLLDRFDEALKRWPKLAALWARGEKDGDKSGSGMVMSLACHLRNHGFSLMDFAHLAWLWGFTPGASGRDVNASERSLCRAWAKAEAAGQQQKQDGNASAARAAITPFVLPDHTAIRPRDWLYGDRAYIRGYISATVAPGGAGKSSLVIAEALAMATGRDLLGVKPRTRLRTWYWNSEDPLDELQRRIAAACKHYGITQAELDGHLFVDSGRDSPWSLAAQSRDGVAIDEELAEDMTAKVKANGIDVIVIDPFVGSHRADENSNVAIAAVAAKWGQIADRARCAVMLVHHVRKTQPGTELTTEDARGASSLIGAVRSGRVINRMPADIAVKLGITHPGSFLRITAASEKNNMSIARADDEWFEIVSVDLENGVADPGDGGGPLPADQVGVVARWEPPDIMDGVDAEAARRAQALVGGSRFRLDVRAKDWFGIPVARALGLDMGLDVGGGLKPAKVAGPARVAARERVKAAADAWIEAGWFEVVEEKDAERKTRKFVVVGRPAVSLAEALAEGVAEGGADDPGS